MGDRRCSLLILPCLDRGKDVAAVDDPPVFGVYAKENMDSEDDDDEEYVSDDNVNEEVRSDAAAYFGPYI